MHETQLKMVSKYAFAWLVAVALSGCAVYQFPSEVPDQLEDFRSQITPRKTSRKEVQERLGEPFISDQSVEVYRVLSGHDVTLEGPVVPISWDAEEVIIYALVVYDENDVVEEIDWDLYQHDHEHVSTFIRSAKLQAGDFYFAAFNKGHQFGQHREEVLLAPISSSRRALRIPPPPGMCAVVFFIDETEDWPRLHKGGIYINNELIVEMPLTYGYFDLRVFRKTFVSEGGQEVRAATSLGSGAFRRKFVCQQRNIFYVYPRIEVISTEPWGILRRRFKYEAEIVVNSEPLESHDDWRQLLYYKGEWLGGD